MKRIKSLMLLLTGLLLMQASCEPQPSVPKPIAEIDKLPPATQTGANTFGCLVNGKAWVTRTSLDAIAYNQIFELLTISAQVTGNGKDQGIYLELERKDIEEKKFFFNEDGVLLSFDDSNTACLYDSFSIKSGSLTLSKFDRASGIISGTFEFSAEKEGCIEIDITNGRFDLTLLQ